MKKIFLSIICLFAILLFFCGCVRYLPVEQKEAYSIDDSWKDELKDGRDYSRYYYDEAKTVKQAVKIADHVFFHELGLWEYLGLLRPYNVTYYEKEKLWVVGENVEKMKWPGASWAIFIKAEDGEILGMWLG